MERLGELVRALVAEHPDLDVHTEVRDAEVVPEGSVMVVVPKAADAEWLNLRRPLFARKALKVVLFCDRETTLSLAEHAVDFFDWVSQHHECPPGPAPHAVHGLRCAARAGAPGVLWIGSGKPADAERMWSAFSAALPGETLRWVLPERPWSGGDGHERLIEQLKSAGNDWLACRTDRVDELRRLRWGLAEAGKRSRLLALAPPMACPGWWSIDERLTSLVEARRVLQEADASRPGCLAALTDLEPAAVELARTLLQRGMPHRDAVELLRQAPDPGAALARRALDSGLVDRAQVAEMAAPAPALRALFHDPEVRRLRERRLMAIGRTLKKGAGVSSEAAGFWAATAPAPARVEGRSTRGDTAVEAFVVESQLRLRQRAPGWAIIADRALRLGDADAASHYAWRAVFSKDFPEVRSLLVILDVAFQLSRLGHPRGQTIRTLVLSKSKRLMPSAALLALGAMGSLLFLMVGLFAIEDWNTRARCSGLGLMNGYGVIRMMILRRRLHRALLVRSAKALRALGDELDAASEAAGRGERDRARAILKEALPAIQAELPEGHPLHRLALQHLAMNAADGGDGADTLFEIVRALKLEGQLAVDGALFATLVALLAGVLCRRGGATEAEALLRKLLGTELPAPLDPAMGTLPLEFMGVEDAEVRELLAIFVARPGPLPALAPEIKVRALRHLTEALSAQGRYDEAERIGQIACERAAVDLRAAHPERWRTLAGLGRILAVEHRDEDAKQALEEAAALAEKALGGRHIEVARLLQDLALMKRRTHDAEAGNIARKALAAYADVQCHDAEWDTALRELAHISGDMGGPEDQDGQGAASRPDR
jgi:tetratricopeptide (TPR) repeat protein